MKSQNPIKMNNKSKVKTCLMRINNDRRMKKEAKVKMRMTHQKMNKAMKSLPNNLWRLKTMLSSKWVLENVEEPKWITWWTERRRKKKTPFGRIRDKTILATWKMKNKTKIINKVVLAEISLIVILAKLSHKRKKKKKRWRSLNSMSKSSKKKGSSRSSCEK